MEPPKLRSACFPDFLRPVFSTGQVPLCAGRLVSRPFFPRGPPPSPSRLPWRPPRSIASDGSSRIPCAHGIRFNLRVHSESRNGLRVVPFLFSAHESHDKFAIVRRLALRHGPGRRQKPFRQPEFTNVTNDRKRPGPRPSAGRRCGELPRNTAPPLHHAVHQHHSLPPLRNLRMSQSEVNPPATN